MRLYIVRWPNLECSLVSAESDDDLMHRLDEVADPSDCRWAPYVGCVWIDFALPPSADANAIWSAACADVPKPTQSEWDEACRRLQAGEPGADRGIESKPDADYGRMIDAPALSANGLDGITLGGETGETFSEMLAAVAQFAWPAVYRTIVGAEEDAEDAAAAIRDAVRADHVSHARGEVAAVGADEDDPGHYHYDDPEMIELSREAPPEAAAPAKDERPPQSVVYVLRGANDGFIKIGVTTNLSNRLRDIRHMSAVPVELLWVFPGDRRVEQALHKRFAKHRRHGEWFEPAKPLIEWIDAERWGKAR